MYNLDFDIIKNALLSPDFIFQESIINLSFLTKININKTK